ncbi:adhesion G protein-coupled receptor E1 [Amia ocellicauda]|uniref:adhesion G protein-coupled receptor E1 n=1 Tax=Amia ocellicauda TaxID=2972642 RepID=UPI003463C4F9
MWLEGVHLLLLIKNLRVVKYSSRNQVCTLHLLLVGYGIPAVIVAISAGVYSEGYGTAKSCWLSHERKFIWSFLGPVCFIIVVNIIIFALILYGLRSQIGNLNTDLSKLRDNRLLTFKAISHFFIMGCSWILGFFQTIGFLSYAFVIVNSLQGPFIFLVHCVLNKQIRAEYRRLFRLMHKQKEKHESSAITMGTLSDTAGPSTASVVPCSSDPSDACLTRDREDTAGPSTASVVPWSSHPSDVSVTRERKDESTSQMPQK